MTSTPTRGDLLPVLAATTLALALAGCQSTMHPRAARGGTGGGFAGAAGGSSGTGGDEGADPAVDASNESGTGGKDAGVRPTDAALDNPRDTAAVDGPGTPAVDAPLARVDAAPATDTKLAVDTGQPDGGGSVDPGYGDLVALDKACTPTLTLKLTDTGPKGQIFLDAMGGTAEAAKATILQISREVCRVLYRKASEVRGANALELDIHDYAGVAGKWGDLGDIGIEISTQHLQNVKNQGRDVGAEIKGILFHEITHMYQNDDKPEGTWSGLANYYEAGADAVRIRAGFVPSGCQPGKSGQWYDHNYCSGGWWWLWVDTKYPGFIYRLNLQMKGNDNKAWQPTTATSIAGVSLDALWTEYKTASCCSGANTTCCK
jgi:hypothetical protein